MRITIIGLLAAVCLAGSSGCSFISKAEEFNNVPGPNGKPVQHIAATEVAMHFLFAFPVAGESSVPKAIDNLTAKVKEDGGTNVRIIQSSSHTMWYLYFPVSIFIHPVLTSVSADFEVGPSDESAGE